MICPDSPPTSEPESVDYRSLIGRYVEMHWTDGDGKPASAAGVLEAIVEAPGGGEPTALLDWGYGVALDASGVEVTDRGTPCQHAREPGHCQAPRWVRSAHRVPSADDSAERYRELGALVDWVDKRLDAGVSQQYLDQPLAQDWARVAKVAEEAGEAVDALIGLSGQNPRKGTYGTLDDLLDELADVALTGLYALAHFSGSGPEAVELVLQRARKHKARLAADPEQAAVDLAWHYVTFDVDGWTIEHSLACRQTGRPDTCGFLAAIHKVAGEPDPDLFGRHRITEIDTEGLPWLERVDDPPEVP